MKVRSSLITIPAFIATQLVAEQPDKFTDHWMIGQVDGLVRAAYAAAEHKQAVPAYRNRLGELAASLKECRRDRDEQFLNRWRRFLDYVETASLDLKPDHQLGFNVSDKEYFAETSQYVEIPGFLLDQDFVKWASRAETLDKAKTYLRSLNLTRSPSDQLTFLSYRSRHLGTPDNNNSFLRLLIVVPGDAGRRIPEKWVQFGVTDPGVKPLTRNISVVSALLNPDGTFNSYFKDYYRIYRRSGPIEIKGRWELGYGDDNCVQCHKTGVLPIFPKDDSVASDEKSVLWAVNERFESYGQPRFDKYLNETKFGPGLAAAEPGSRAKRFGETFETTIVGKAMVCANCHDGNGLGSLNWPMSQKVISSFVKGGRMPRGHSLDQTDRNELYRKLLAEYFATDAANPGILKSWLLPAAAKSSVE